jgi:predicted Fe-Mo cluster-binding NifX family protein
MRDSYDKIIKGEKMKIGITSKGKDLLSEVDPRFGRCSFFLIVEDETMDYESISNESAMSSGGAGIQAAQTIAKSGIDLVITGNIGPNAFQTLSLAGIKVFTGASGNIKEVIEKFKNGELKEINAPNVNRHSGIRK